jgi:hypothetical protein
LIPNSPIIYQSSNNCDYKITIKQKTHRNYRLHRPVWSQELTLLIRKVQIESLLFRFEQPLAEVIVRAFCFRSMPARHQSF